MAESPTGPGTLFPFALTFREAIWFYWQVRHWRLTASSDGGAGDIGDGSGNDTISWSSAAIDCTSDDVSNAENSQNMGRELDLLRNPATSSMLRTSAISEQVAVTGTYVVEDPSSSTPFSGHFSASIGPGYVASEDARAISWLGMKYVSGARRFYPPLYLVVSLETGSPSFVGLEGNSIASAPEVGTWRLVLPGRSLTTPIYGTVSHPEHVPPPTIGEVVLQAHSPWPYSV